MAEASCLTLPAGQHREFYVLDTEEKNAFVLPAGKVYVHRGLMELLVDEGELEVILGHEIAHVQAQHASERMSLQRFPHVLKFMYLLLLSCGVPLAVDPTLWQLDLTQTLFFSLPFSRVHEAEADAIGLDNLVRACVDPHLALTVWEKMEASSVSEGGLQLPSFTSTHPNHGERLDMLRSKLDLHFELYEDRCTEEKIKIRELFKVAEKLHGVQCIKGSSRHDGAHDVGPR